MANNALVGVPVAGGVLAAPTTAAQPTDASTALTGFTALGLVSEDGVSETTERGTEDVRAWGGDIARTVQTDFGLTYTFTLLETNATVLQEIHGVDNVTASGTTGTEALAIKINEATLPKRSYVFEVKDGDNKIRIAIPNGQITNVGDVTYVHSDVIRYEVTITCYKDDNGANAYKYISGPAAVPAAA